MLSYISIYFPFVSIITTLIKNSLTFSLSLPIVQQLYRTFYIHFVTRVERPLLEQFARDLQLSNSVSCVSKVYDQYLDLIALEPSLFTLNIKDSLIAYNAPSLSEAQIR